MSIQISLKNFEEIYNSTYNYILKYIVCNCSNIEDVNDLIQETYVEFYKILKRKKFIVLENYSNYIIGIARKRIQKYYGILYKIKDSSILNKSEEKEFEINIPSNIDLEADTINKLNAEMVWKYIKKGDITTIRVFYLYYYSQLKISQIAKELKMNESSVKNILYRTIRKIKENVKIEGDIDV